MRERLLLDAEEVRRQHLDRRLRQLRPQRADRCGVVPGAAVGEVVAVDRRDDDVLEAHLRRRLGEAQRLERIDRVGRGRVHVAVAARAAAVLAEDLERRGTAAPALGDVRAARLLADRVQARAVDQLLDVVVAVVALGARTFIHSGRRGRSATGSDPCMRLSLEPPVPPPGSELTRPQLSPPRDSWRVEPEARRTRKE